MNLQIRNPRAHELACELAKRRNVSITDAVIDALETELARTQENKPLKERLQTIADSLWAQRQPGGRDMTKEEIDAMWGHE